MVQHLEGNFPGGTADLHYRFTLTGDRITRLAAQNRERILQVAREELAGATDVSLHRIAQRAGVGQGTLYRHFPTREALLMAVYRHDVTALVEAADDLVTAHPPTEALRLWLDRLAAFGRVKNGLSDVLHLAIYADLSAEHYQPVIEAIRVLLRAGQDAGTVRADIEPEDLLLLVSFLWHGDQDAEWDRRSRHMLEVVLDGLRPT